VYVGVYAKKQIDDDYDDDGDSDDEHRTGRSKGCSETGGSVGGGGRNGISGRQRTARASKGWFV